MQAWFRSPVRLCVCELSNHISKFMRLSTICEIVGGKERRARVCMCACRHTQNTHRAECHCSSVNPDKQIIIDIKMKIK